ncbi:hypothetical protein GCM10023116_29340 [Kistimonas scapharcae]|uniref:Uncharacterized protein n=1 Tax=Kistimonas scapharcae TaxID=1036133 RepID=A0ABP8V3Z8_9GAMM
MCNKIDFVRTVFIKLDDSFYGFKFDIPHPWLMNADAIAEVNH